MPPCRKALLQAKLSAKRWSTRTDLTNYLEEARNYIEQTPLDEITLDALAVHVGLSKYHLLRAFKETYNTTPLRFATIQKLEQSKPLLDAQTVEETAIQLGFSGATTFGRAFHRHFGVTPSDFRNFSRAESNSAELK